MATVDKNSRDSGEEIVLLLTELALIFVDEFAHKILDLLGRAAGDLLGLFEEERGGVLEGFHVSGVKEVGIYGFKYFEIGVNKEVIASDGFESIYMQ